MLNMKGNTSNVRWFDLLEKVGQLAETKTDFAYFANPEFPRGPLSIMDAILLLITLPKVNDLAHNKKSPHIVMIFNPQ